MPLNPVNSLIILKIPVRNLISIGSSSSSNTTYINSFLSFIALKAWIASERWKTWPSPSEDVPRIAVFTAPINASTSAVSPSTNRRVPISGPRACRKTVKRAGWICCEGCESSVCDWTSWEAGREDATDIWDWDCN